jgi:hypothetical protein
MGKLTNPLVPGRSMGLHQERQRGVSMHRHFKLLALDVKSRLFKNATASSADTDQGRHASPLERVLDVAVSVAERRGNARRKRITERELMVAGRHQRGSARTAHGVRKRARPRRHTGSEGCRTCPSRSDDAPDAPRRNAQSESGRYYYRCRCGSCAPPNEWTLRPPPQHRGHEFQEAG